LEILKMKDSDKIVRRAYSVIDIKSIDEEKREITGIATTPSVDSYGDIVEPKGAEFKLPLPFLWQHNSSQPIGHVTRAKVKNDGIEVTINLVKTDEPGTLKERLDEAWQSIKLKLVRGLSIGFRSIEHNYIEGTHGVHFLKWAWLELSAVTIAANGDATITAIKSADMQNRAASGHAVKRVVSLNPPAGATARPNQTNAPEGMKSMKNIRELIEQLEAKFVATQARQMAIQEKATGESRLKDASEREEFENLSSDLDAITAELKDLRELEKRNVATAKPVPATPDPNANPQKQAAAARDAGRAIQIDRPLEKGIAFARFVGSMVHAKGDRYAALQFAKRRFADDQKLHSVLDLHTRMSPNEIVQRAAIDVGTTTDSDYAAPLVYAQQMASDFIDYLRPETIIGKLESRMRRVPFNVRMPRQTGGGTAQWVGEGKPKPITQQAFDSVTLGYMKLAVISVITEELARFSSPSAETIIRDDLAKAIIQASDSDFVDPDNAGTANVKPASITSGVTPLSSAGNSEANARADLGALFSQFIGNSLSLTSAAFIMPMSTALRLSLMVNSLGNRSFADITPAGGTLLGIPVVTSENAGLTDASANGKIVILASLGDILLADDGQVAIDVSREASVQMDSAPTDPTAAGTVLESLWQRNLVGIKAERFMAWAKARSTAVSYVQSVNWGE
jgi:HK97 family phage major capsid protein/HK97 family phage prohead protease